MGPIHYYTSDIKTVSPPLVLQLLYIFSKNWWESKLYNAPKTWIRYGRDTSPRQPAYKMAFCAQGRNNLRAGLSTIRTTGAEIRSTIDLMHWRHVSITTTPCWGSRLVALRAHVLLAERIGAHPLSQCAHPGQLGGEACRGFALWVHAWRWCTWRASFDPQHHGGALLWRHMHMVYWRKKWGGGRESFERETLLPSKCYLLEIIKFPLSPKWKLNLLLAAPLIYAHF